MQKYDTRVIITAKDLLAGGYDTRVVTPRYSCPKCHGRRPDVIGAQCYRDGRVFGEYRCGFCGELYGEQLTFR